MAVMSVRVDDWLKGEIEQFWRAHGETPSTGLRRMAEEWWAMQHFSSIVFRDGVSGRRAALRDGPDVWEIAAVAKDYDGDIGALREHFAPHVAAGDLDQALAYAERFGGRIEEMIEQNRRMERMLTGEP
jgi:hypothetical protein